MQSKTVTNTTIDQTSDEKFDSYDDRKIKLNRVMKQFRTYMGDNSISSQSHNFDPRFKDVTTPTEKGSVMKLGL